MKRAIVTLGWENPSFESCEGEYSVIASPLPAARVGSLGAWQGLAHSMDVELSASWLVFHHAAAISDEVRRAFLGSIDAATRGECVRSIRRLQAEAARSRVITDFQVTAKRCAALRKARKRVVFTNGVFDLFHIGHLRLLRAARALGDALVVGINSDESARSLKGRTRPVVPQFARAELVAAVRGVDLCVVFTQDDPRALLRVVRPDVLAKGSEYALTGVVGRRMVAGWGGRVVLLPHLEGWSSTQVIRILDSRTRGGDATLPRGGR